MLFNSLQGQLKLLIVSSVNAFVLYPLKAVGVDAFGWELDSAERVLPCLAVVSGVDFIRLVAPSVGKRMV